MPDGSPDDGSPDRTPDDREVVQLCVDRMVELVGRERAVELARSADGLELTDEGELESVTVDGPTALDRLVVAFEPVGGDLVSTLLAGVIASEFDVRRVDLPDRLAVEIERAV